MVLSNNTRHLQDYHISSIRTAKRLKTLRRSGPRIWNSLPSEIKAINNFQSQSQSQSLITKGPSGHLQCYVV